MKTDLILPESVCSFMDVFTKKKFEIYVVGGAVRQMLLNKPVLNWDFTTNATPEQILSLFEKTFYNNNFGTVSVVANDYIFEVTPYRTEGNYLDNRHPETLTWAKTIEEDLSRRDFTINAMAFDGSKLIDLFGGADDLEKKIIKTVGEPNTRFQEDALRLMRAVRIASQLGFVLDSKTHESIKKNADLIENVSKERVRDELFKILESDNASGGIMLLRNVGLLTPILPEVDVCFDVPQRSPGRHHVYDVGTHLIMALKLCPNPDVVTRFATLLHDIGKADTYKKDEETEIITFYNHEHIGAQKTAQIADRLRLSKKQKEKLVTLVRCHMFTVSEKQTDKAIRRFIKLVGKEYLFDILDLRVADRLGSGAKLTSWRTELFKKRLEEVQQEPFLVKDLAIDGHDVMTILNIKPSRTVGEILDEIFVQVIEHGLANDRESLLTYLDRFSSHDKSGTATKGDE